MKMEHTAAYSSRRYRALLSSAARWDREWRGRGRHSKKVFNDEIGWSTGSYMYMFPGEGLSLHPKFSSIRLGNRYLFCICI